MLTAPQLLLSCYQYHSILIAVETNKNPYSFGWISSVFSTMISVAFVFLILFKS